MSSTITNPPTVNTHMKDTEPAQTPHPSKALLEPGTLHDAKRIQEIELLGIGTWTDGIKSTQLSSASDKGKDQTHLLELDARSLGLFLPMQLESEGSNGSDAVDALSVPVPGKESVNENVALTSNLCKEDGPRQSFDTASVQGFRYISVIHHVSSWKGDDNDRGGCRDADWTIV